MWSVFLSIVMGPWADSYRALETTFTKMGSYYQRISSLQRKRPDKKRESMSDYDHSYYTMASFADDHVDHAAKHLFA
jgi:hypothetical protein